MRAAGWCVRRAWLSAASVVAACPSAQEGSPGSSVTSASSALPGSLVQSMVRLMPLARGIGAVSSYVNERSVRATELITGVGGNSIADMSVWTTTHPHMTRPARDSTRGPGHMARATRTTRARARALSSVMCLHSASSCTPPDSLDRRLLTNQCTCGVAACLTRSCVCVCVCVCFSSETSSWTSVRATRSFLFTACSLGPSRLFL